MSLLSLLPHVGFAAQIGGAVFGFLFGCVDTNVFDRSFDGEEYVWSELLLYPLCEKDRHYSVIIHNLVHLLIKS